MTTEALNWQPPLPLPDADTDVIVSLDIDGALETYEAHHDGECWRDSTGMNILVPVTAWAHKPAGVDLRGGAAA